MHFRAPLAFILALAAIVLARADDFFVTCQGDNTIVKLSNTLVPTLRPDNTTVKIPGTIVSTFTTGKQFFFGVRADRFGNLFVPNPGANNILKYPCIRGTISDTPSVFAAGLNMPRDLDFDPQGNLYEIDASGNINKFVFSGGILSNQPILFTNGSPAHANLNGDREPMNMAFDAKGNLYLSILIGGILKFTHSASGLANMPDSTPFSTISRAREMAFDKDGNMFVANHLMGDVGVYEFRNSPSGLSGEPITFAQGDGLNGPEGAAFDSQGNLYITNWGYGSGDTILEYPRTNGVLSNKPVVFGSDFNAPNFILPIKTAR